MTAATAAPLTTVDAAVLGGGLSALVTALELRRRGDSVALVRSQTTDGPSHELGLVTLGPGRPYAAVVRELGRGAARLVWAAGAENHLRLRALLEDARHSCGYRPHGSFLLATTREEAGLLAESEDLLQEDGFQGEFLDHYMFEMRFAAAGLNGAYWAAPDADLDALRLFALVETLVRAAGVVCETAPVRAVAVGSAGAVVETERGTIRAGVLVVASDGRELTLVPEIARLVRVATARALRGAAAAEAALPFAVRTADGRIAWQAREGRLSLLETGFEEARPSAALTLLAKLPMAPGSLRDHTEDVVMTLDGLPVVGRLPGRPLAVLTGLLPNPVSLAFAGARWVADALRTGSDPTPTPLRPTRPKLGPAV